MAIIPILLDERPHYFEGAPPTASLLLTPLRTGTLLEEIVASLRPITPSAPVVLPRFARHDRGYQEGILRACPVAHRIVPPEILTDPLGHFDPADTLLLLSPRWYPANGLDLRDFASASAVRSQSVHHLLALETNSLHTKELVHCGAEARVRRVQRYYEPVTWPFTTGVVASLVPVASLLRCGDAATTFLVELRTAFTMSGVPSIDISLHDHVYDLATEEGMLALAEQRVLAPAPPARARSPRQPISSSPAVAPPAPSIAPTARLLGTVVVREGAVIEDGTLVVGPALIGPGAHVGHGATIAQSVIGADVSVPGDATIRHRVVTGRDGTRTHVHPRRHGSPLSYAPPGRGQRDRYGRVKALVEPALALLVLALLSPLLVAIGLLVVLTSPGSVFYGDLREGKDGRLFRCWKFRTMLVNADAMQRALAATQDVDGPHFKMEHDPRVTAVGRWLRALTLDELPQIVNVLCGQMSFVGPRPAPFRENQICVPWRRGRLSVRPGMTGLWQVCRHDRSVGDFHQWIEYDLLYVEHASLLVDVKIVLATIVTLLSQRPADVNQIIGTHHADRHRPTAHGTTPLARALSRAAWPWGGNAGAARRAALPRNLVMLALLCLGQVPLLGAQATGQEQPIRREKYWTVGVDVGEGYEHNALFQEPGGESSQVSSISGEFGGTLRNERTQFDLAVIGGSSRYKRSLSSLNQFTYGARAALTHAATPRLTLTSTAIAQMILSSDVPTASEHLPLLPLALSRAQSVSAGVGYRVSPITSFASDVAYTHTTFSSSLLSGGDAISGRLLLRRAYKPSATLGLVYEIERSTTAPLAVTTNTLSSEWITPAGPFQWRMRVGASALQASDVAGWAVKPVGEAELSTHGATDVAGFALHYSRSVGQAFGLARVLTTDEIGFTAGRTIPGSIAVAIGANQGWSTAPDLASQRITLTSITTDLRRSMFGSLWFGVGGFYRRRIEHAILAESGIMLTAGYHARL